MASDLRYSDALRTARAQALADFAGNGALLRIYSGTKPADADTALAGNTLLAELVCGSPLEDTITNGVLTFDAIASDAGITNGTAAFARLVKSDGTTVVLDCTVGTSGADINLNSVSIVTGATVSVTSAVITGSNA